MGSTALLAPKDGHKLPTLAELRLEVRRPLFKPYDHGGAYGHDAGPLRTIPATATTADHVDRQTLFTRAHDTAMSPHEIAALKAKDGLPQNIDMGTEEYKQLVKDTFSEIFKRDTLSLDDTTPDRIRAAWRIVREMARSKRLIGLDEPLISSVFSATPTSLDMWTMPTECPDVPSTFEYLSKPDTTASATYLQLAADALRLREDYWCWSLSEIVSMDHTDNPEEYDPNAKCHFQPPENPFTIRAGLPLLPPPVPLKYYDDHGRINDLYKTENDPCLNLYIRAVDNIADYLGIYNGSESQPESGRRGMMGLASANICRLAFPTKMQLIAWEYLLITETLWQLTNKGAVYAFKWLMHKYGYNHIETNGILRMTKRFARDLVNAERAEDRAVMLLRCEQMMKRARGALDLKAEHNAMKQMSAILGLTRTEEDETLSDFVAVVKNQTNQRIAMKAAKRLASPKANDPQFDLSLDD